MASSQQGVQIGESGFAFFRGLPGKTGDVKVTWKGRDGTTSHVASVFSSMSKGRNADVADSYGNKGEWLASRRRNLRLDVQLEAKPTGAKESAAQIIAEDPPTTNDLVTITGVVNDTNMNSAGWIVTGSPTTRFTPEGEAVISMSLRLYLNDDGSAIVPAPLDDV